MSYKIKSRYGSSNKKDDSFFDSFLDFFRDSNSENSVSSSASASSAFGFGIPTQEQKNKKFKVFGEEIISFKDINDKMNFITNTGLDVNFSENENEGLENLFKIVAKKVKDSKEFFNNSSNNETDENKLKKIRYFVKTLDSCR